MKIAMVGTRGVPASYSGFETCAEELGSRLVQRGHQVTVYCRSHHIDYPWSHYRGMRLVKLPTIRNKYLDTIVHTLVSSLHLVTHDVDAALYFIVGNSPLLAIPRARGIPCAINVDGLDWKREKWPPPAQRYLQWSESVAVALADAVITDSRMVHAYYLQHHGRETTYIPYGSETEPTPPGPMLARLGLAPRRYLLFVGRLVPENRVHDLTQAYRDLSTDMPCVIVGDAPYADDYIRELRADADDRTIFTGYQFGAAYRELLSNAFAFIETSAVGGTHPALLEAMAAGNCVIINDTAENRETIGDAGLGYDGQQGAAGLGSVLESAIRDPDRAHRLGSHARARARALFSWDAVTDQYEQLLLDLASRSDGSDHGESRSEAASDVALRRPKKRDRHA